MWNCDNSMFLYQVPYYPGDSLVAFENFPLLLISNALLVCTYIFNTVHLLYGVIFNRCTLCNLFTSAKTFVCLSIVVEGYFWDYVGIMTFTVSLTLFLWYKFIYDVTFNSAILIEIMILWVDSTVILFIFIYVCFYNAW